MAPYNRESSDFRKMKSTFILTRFIGSKITKSRDRDSSGFGMHNRSASSRRLSRKRDSPVTAKPVIFLVGFWSKQKFVEHPYTLASKSDVFATMLMNGSRWSTDRTIQITDVKPLAFKLLLMSIKSVEGVKSIQSHLTIPVALDTYFAAHKYNVTELGDFLIKYIHRHANPDNILQVLRHAEIYGLRVLEGFCWSVIERKTFAVIQSDAFEKISWDNLCSILDNSRLSIKEFELFLATMRWSNCELKRWNNRSFKNKSNPSEKKTKNAFLGSAIRKIRFPLLTKSELEYVKRTGILSPAEVEDLEVSSRKNTTFCGQKRNSDCYCRRNHRSCPLCVDSHFTSSGQCIAPVDGRVAVKNETGGRKRWCYTSKIRELSKNQAQRMTICECMKYISCPAFPNGVTATIMLSSHGASCPQGSVDCYYYYNAV